MLDVPNTEQIDEEQLNYLYKESFAGYKRFKNWQSLVPKLANLVPVFQRDRQLLITQFETELGTLLSTINRLNLTSGFTISDRNSFLKFYKKYDSSRHSFFGVVSKQLKSVRPTARDSEIEEETKKEISVLEAILSKLLITNGKVSNVETNLEIVTKVFNEFIDDYEGIKFQSIKKTERELFTERTKISKDALNLAKEICKIQPHLTSSDIPEQASIFEEELLSDIELEKLVKITRNTSESLTFINRILSPKQERLNDYNSHCSSTLLSIIKVIQQQYLSDKRPWVIGYSGGKDSSAVLTLVYLALLTLKDNQRIKRVYVVASDTLVETPVVVGHIAQSLETIGKQALRDDLPITVHKVVPDAKESFWSCLLGKGYPAPTKSFRWCTERMKIDPVSDFIKAKVSQFDEVVVVLGSRSEESASRAQVIKKHKIEGTRLARHTTLPNAFIFTPIDTWSMDDVWKLLRNSALEMTSSPLGIGKKWLDDYELEWENPWSGKNLKLWNLYKDSSDQGECPMVIDDSTPSCGNSRFGCWTCTVVTKDRAMESLIQNGEEWMAPLLEFRNNLAMTTAPANKEEYRNHKRRTGKVSYQYAKEGEDIATERKHVPGPYWLKYRRQWLRELLELDKKFKAEGRDIELITVPELHAIRQEWIHDPNEPDWDDSLPALFRDVYGYDLDWVCDDNASFGKDDAQLIHELCDNFDVEPEMIMKLIELEVSMDGLSRRSGISNRIASLLKKDWGSLEEIKQKHASLQSKAEFDIHQKEIERYNEQLADLDKQLQKEF